MAQVSTKLALSQLDPAQLDTQILATTVQSAIPAAGGGAAGVTTVQPSVRVLDVNVTTRIQLAGISRASWNAQVKKTFADGLVASLGLADPSLLTVGDPDTPLPGARRSAADSGTTVIGGVSVPFSVSVGPQVGAGTRASAISTAISIVAQNVSSPLHAALEGAGIQVPAIVVQQQPTATVTVDVALPVPPTVSPQQAVQQLTTAVTPGGAVEKKLVSVGSTAAVQATPAVVILPPPLPPPAPQPPLPPPPRPRPPLPPLAPTQKLGCDLFPCFPVR